MVEVLVNATTTNSKSPEPNNNHNSGRRTSARIQMKQKAGKEVLVRKRVELLDKEENEILEDDINEAVPVEVNSTKMTKKLKGTNSGSLVKKNREESMEESDDEKEKTYISVSISVSEKDGKAGGGVAGKSAHARLKDTIRLFNKHYLHFVQEEELRCAKAEADTKPPAKGSMKSSKALKSKKKGREADVNEEEKQKTKMKRPDLKAISKMIQSNEVMYPEKRIGALPGVDVGHRFYSRCEMVAVGFHSHWLNGIDYMGQSYSKGEYSNYSFPLAVAIVLSGMYEDDLDNAEDVIYTGQGGHDLTGNKRQIKDQKLERGNLALKNNVEQCVPVRVIRGHECESSYSGKVYTYDGLYKVIQYWGEKGISGFTVFKFRLRRIEGQPILTTTQVRFTNGKVPESLSEIQGLVSEDISGDLEDVPIVATNLVDDPPVAPAGFKYIKDIQVAKNVVLPVIASGCNCKGTCVDPRTCACAKLNGSDFPYVQRDGGRLIEPKDVVFECNPKCGCGPGCVNRTSQRGLKHRFEVFKTPKKGWAVRSWDFIPAGAPICEYVGKLMRTEDLDHISGNNYIFEIDCLQTMRGLEGRERRQKDASIPAIANSEANEDQKSDGVEFGIDAGSVGNIARFINHSCEPNLFVQCVLSSHHDIKLARVMLVAADNIPPLQELTYDYGYVLDSVHDADGNIIQMPCYCGALECRKRLF